MALQADDIGARVVVRYRRTDPGSGPPLTDVLGELVALDATTVSVRRADGTSVTVPAEAVLAARRIPPAPSRRGGPALDAPVAELEAMAAHGWRGLDEVWLGGWLLRAADGFTGRANSALPLGDPGLPRAESLAEVRQFYAGRGLPAQIQVALPRDDGLDDALAAEGWVARNGAHFLVADTAEVLQAAAGRPDLPPVQLSGTPDEAWLAGYLYRGAVLPAGAVRVLTHAERPTFASVSDGDTLLAVARGVVHDGWLGVTALTVAESGRRRGLGRHVMRALVEWGLGHGARSLYLQVAEENAGALALYAGLGLREHHRYHYRRAPD